ncbi:periplasmic heavy metal sensor [Roseomonas sp. HJA6]|uniref:Periplasmic heavy metal sensor n=1 Tax=Roseomonas alba TaxID=2846776 RepID=A0ABS7AE89_9PROT|nr:periplasmic heavy metal sensor [Neoroseomonas alba]MBW6400052.1 periplasmic heavy metal sensor [Neoroseomonas alba]
MPPLTPRRLRVMVAMSIGLNLFLVAIIGAQRWRAVQLERMAAPNVGALEAQVLRDPERGLGLLSAGLSERDSTILRDAIRIRLADLLVARRDFAAAVDLARSEIARDPVDLAALRESIERARRQRQRFGPLLEEIILDAVPRMSPEGRQALSRLRGVAAPLGGS